MPKKAQKEEGNWIVLAISIAILVLAVLIYKKVDTKEGFCVDISGGLPSPCGDCTGNCPIDE